MISHQVHDIWRFKTLKALYEPNLFPVVFDSIRADGTTIPPRVRLQPGRPKKNRFRRRVQRDGMVSLETTLDVETEHTQEEGDHPEWV